MPRNQPSSRQTSRCRTRRRDLNDLLLKSIAFGEDLFSSPPAQGPPFEFIRERDHRWRCALCRSMLKLIPLMGPLILTKPYVLRVVEALPLFRHSSYLVVPIGPDLSFRPRLRPQPRPRHQGPQTRLKADSTWTLLHSAMGRCPCGIVPSSSEQTAPGAEEILAHGPS